MIMDMSREELRRAIGMWGLALCLLSSAAGWVFLRFGQAWSIADLPISDMVNYIVPSYAVTEVAMIPVGGKIIDKYGCRTILAVAPFIFIIASMLCIVSVSVEMLVTMRVIQGIGAGLVLALAFTSVGKYYDSDKRGKCNELMTGAFAIGSLFSSALGYFLTELINWRFGFVFLSIIMLIGFLIAWRFLPVDEGTGGKTDLVGLVLAAAAFAFVTFYAQMIDVLFDLRSTTSIIMGAISVVLIAAVIIHARHTKDPSIPVRFSAFEKMLFFLMFMFSICGLGLIQYFFKLYLTYYEFDIYKATSMFIFMLIGGATTSMIGLRFVYRTGCRPWVVGGSVMVTFSLIFTHFFAGSGQMFLALSLFLFGLGLGSIVTEIICSMQTVVEKKDLGVHTGSLMALRMVAILTGNVIIGTYINEVIRDAMPPSVIDLTVTEDIAAAVGEYVNDTMHYLANSMNDGFLTTALCLSIVTGILTVVAFFIGKRDVTEMKRLKAEEEGADSES